MWILDKLRGLFQRGRALIWPVRASSFSNRSLADNETVFAAVGMLANSIASAPVALRQNYRKVLPAEHPAARMFEYGPNPQMSMFDFIRAMETMRDTAGAAYAVKELDGQGRTVALWPLRSEYVTPMIERSSRDLYYRVLDELAGTETYLHDSMVVAVRHIGGEGVLPISPLRVLQNSLDYDRQVKEFSLDQMTNGLRAKLVIQYQGDLGDADVEAMDSSLKRFKHNGILYLGQGTEAKELQNNTVIDPKVFEVENITVARVARVFNIPLGKLLAGATSYSSAEQEDLNYLKDTILPLARMYEQELSRKLLTERERDAGMQVKMALQGFARGDMQTRADYYFKAVRSAWMSPNEIRALEDDPPYEGGDGYYISKDMVPVDQLGRETAADDPASILEAEGAEIARVSLNGAQISSILEVIGAVLGGQMEYGAAVTLLTSAFPFDEPTAREILGDASRRTEGGEPNE